MKVDLDLVEHALRHKAELDDVVVRSVLKELKEQIEAEAAARKEESGPREEKTYTVLATAPADKDGYGVGYVVYHATTLPPQEVGDLIREVIAAYKNQPKGRKKVQPVTSFGEAFECIPAKFFKEKGLQVKTKEAVYTVPLPNNTIYDYDKPTEN